MQTKDLVKGINLFLHCEHNTVTMFDSTSTLPMFRMFIDVFHRGEQGEETLKITEVLSRGDHRLDGVKSVTVTATYDWRPVSLSCIPS